MKRALILLFMSVVSAAIVVIGSIATADRAKYNNDFVRLFPPHFTRIVSTTKTDKRVFSIAGFVKDKMYLHNRSDDKLYRVTNNQVDSTPVGINISRKSEIVIDSPGFFVHNGYIPILERGGVSNWAIDTTFEKLPGFTLMQPISKTTAILRSVDLAKRKSVFVRSDMPGSPKDILIKQVDGILCTDGSLGYSKAYRRIVYTYRYRNEFIVMDTMLNIKLVGKTIDTTSTAKISVAEVNGEIKMSKPPLVVNKGASVDGKYLFVYSKLKARNETIEHAEKNSVIDVYDLVDGHYVCSFYVENINRSRMQSFVIHNHILTALFPGYIVQYDLNQEYLPD